MNQSELKTLFGGVGEYSKTPVYLQLREIFGRYIGSQPHNSLFPSERELSDALGINRRTISKALDPFVKDGTLVRGHKGTAICKQNASTPPESCHPFVFQSIPRITEKTQVVFTLFENLPGQKEFWEKTAGGFNRSTESSKVILDWLPASVAAQEKYFDHIKERRPDIFQLHLPRSFSPRLKELSRPLPDDIVSALAGDGYWFSSLTKESRVGGDFFAPVSFSVRVFAWNEKLLRERGVPAPHGPLDFGKTKELLGVAEQKSGGGFPLVAHIEDIFTCFPARQGRTPESARRFFAEMFQGVVSLRGKEKWFKAAPDSVYEIFDSTSLFLSEKVPFTGALLLSLGNMNGSGVEFKFSLPPPAGDESRCSGVVGLILSKGGGSPEAAADFIRHAVSPSVQTELSKITRTCAVHKGANAGLLDLTPLSMEELGRALSCNRALSADHIRMGSLCYEARKLFYPRLLGGGMSVETAVEGIMEIHGRQE